MNYYVNDIQGVKHGPVSEKDLSALAKEGLIRPDSPVKKELMQGWFPASELKFLAGQFSSGSADNGRKEEVPGPSSAPEASVISTFENKLVPVHAGLLLRLQAACFDLIIQSMILLLILGAGTLTAFSLSETVKDSPAVQSTLKKREAADKKAAGRETEPKPKKERAFVERAGRPSIVSDERAGYFPGSVWKDSSAAGQTFVCLSATEKKAVWCRQSTLRSIAYGVWCVSLLSVALILMIPVALAAQTRGMKYFGIFFSDAADPLREVLEIRAVAAWFIGLIAWPVTPFLLLFRKPTVAEALTRTRIIRTAAKKG